MAKKQTRRSVSLSKDTYNLLKAKCDKEGVTMSGIVSQLIEEYLSGKTVAIKAKDRAEDEPDEDETDEIDETDEVEVEADEDDDEDGEGKRASGPRFVVNTDLIVAGPETEAAAEQLVSSLVQRLVKKGEIAEALILSADPE